MKSKRAANLTGSRELVKTTRRENVRCFSEAWNQFSREVALSELAIDPDNIFGNLRAR